ncbi:MAG TPA: histidine phosphatase family protein [Balneolales bacterium]|nr:histidine phosphatase family protein [Balneolales bacterium]HYX06595.1 histidine phosphatase family protein [Bacteroidales bacterium]
MKDFEFSLKTTKPNSKLTDKTRIFIARHGETDYNKNHIIQGCGVDAELNELGNLQAISLANYFEDKELDAVYSSNLLRAKQTATPVSHQKNLPLQSYAELNEMNFGVYEGQMYHSVQDKFITLHEEWGRGLLHNKCEEGESPIEVFERANHRCQEIIDSHKNETILIVMHGRLIRVLLASWLGWGLERMNDIETPNVSVNEIDKIGDTFVPVRLNITDHVNDIEKNFVLNN